MRSCTKNGAARALVVTWALVLALGVSGCGSSAGESVAGLTTVDEFCLEAIKACETVTLPQCIQIVEDAGKSAASADIDCARTSKSCDDTGACLDRLPGGGGPSSQPSS